MLQVLTEENITLQNLQRLLFYIRNIVLNLSENLSKICIINC